MRSAAVYSVWVQCCVQCTKEPPNYSATVLPNTHCLMERYLSADSTWEHWWLLVPYTSVQWPACGPYLLTRSIHYIVKSYLYAILNPSVPIGPPSPPLHSCFSVALSSEDAPHGGPTPCTSTVMKVVSSLTDPWTFLGVEMRKKMSLVLQQSQASLEVVCLCNNIRHNLGQQCNSRNVVLLFFTCGMHSKMLRVGSLRA